MSRTNTDFRSDLEPTAAGAKLSVPVGLTDAEIGLISGGASIRTVIRSVRRAFSEPLTRSGSVTKEQSYSNVQVKTVSTVSDQ